MYKCKHKYLGNTRAFTFVEVIITTGIVIFLIAVVFLLLSRSQGSFFDADASIDLRNQVRGAFQKMNYELRQTGFDSSSNAQFTLANATGVNATDILTFSMPVLCVSTMTTILNSSGDPAYWGAPLTWGCTTSSCMDANNSCSTLEYKYIRYQLDASNNLVRQVLSSTNQLVAQTTLAKNITDFQVSTPGGGNGRIITVSLTAQKQSVTKRTVSVTVTQKILVSNYGT